MKIPKTVTYRGKRYSVLGHYYDPEVARVVATQQGGKAVHVRRYDPAYLVIRKYRTRL